MLDEKFYKGKRILVTGHTGFKGTWLCKMLLHFGAEVTGIALSPITNPSLFNLIGLDKTMTSIMEDIRDLDSLMRVFDNVQPEMVFHLAAQPLVRYGYENPVVTYETNVMGTVNILECIRRHDSVKSVVNVTTDKVYLNREWEWGYRENEELNGYDPYSNSKSCSELVTSSYIKSFFQDRTISVSTARAGNVIGGGDFSANRIIPDCVRAAIGNGTIHIRQPHSIRPYQHVLEPLYVYLMIAEKQYKDSKYAGCYNVGPEEQDCMETGDLVKLFVKAWGGNLKWCIENDLSVHEAEILKLDCSKLKKVFSWKPHWNLEQAVCKVVEWSKCWINGEDVEVCMDRQIENFLQ